MCTNTCTWGKVGWFPRPVWYGTVWQPLLSLNRKVEQLINKLMHRANAKILHPTGPAEQVSLQGELKGAAPLVPITDASIKISHNAFSALEGLVWPTYIIPEYGGGIRMRQAGKKGESSRNLRAQNNGKS